MQGELPIRYAVVKFDLNVIRIPGVYMPTIRKTLAMVQERDPMIFDPGLLKGAGGKTVRI